MTNKGSTLNQRMDIYYSLQAIILSFTKGTVSTNNYVDGSLVFGSATKL